jgi:ABC-type phosphate transport system substrate-binding protein
MIPNFQAQYPTITVQASGTGSGTGYSSVITSQSNIAAVSRPPTSSEISLATANGVKLVGWTIGADAITIIYNPSIGVTELNLTAQQVKQIFEAAAQNEGSIPWSNYVPGASGTITVFSRESGSGTRGDFQEAFGIDNTIMNGALVASSNGQMVTDVSTTSGGIGYCGFAYYTPSGLPAANIAYNSTYDFYAPSIESITSWAQFQLTAGPSPGVQPSTVIYGGTGYFACRFIYYLTNGFPARGSLADKWLGYVLSPAGQHVVDTTGYVSMQTIGYLWPAQQWN